MNVWAPVVRCSANNTVGDLTNDANSFQIVTVSGALRYRASSVADSLAHGTAGQQWADAYAELIVTAQSGSSRIGAGLRLADSSNYYAVYMTNPSSTQIAIDKVVSGTPTNLGSGSVGNQATPGILRAEVFGNTLRAFYKGRLIVTVVDTSIVGPGFVSMYMKPATAVADDEASRFEAGPLHHRYAAMSLSQSVASRN